jgi:hypothetical protein
VTAHAVGDHEQPLQLAAQLRRFDDRQAVLVVLSRSAYIAQMCPGESRHLQMLIQTAANEPHNIEKKERQTGEKEIARQTQGDAHGLPSS